MSSYEASVKRLLRQPESLIKFGLHRTSELLDRLGNPQNRYRTLHVAGTNGKGSTCAMLASILGEAGIQFGWHISPHLMDIRERIRLGNRWVTRAEFVEFEAEVDGAAHEIGDTPTFFEKVYAMACVAFARWGVDVAIVEVGCGGRLDATNVCDPIVCGVTSIGLDHQIFLGDTLGEIAFEKAGIIKEKIPVVDGSRQALVRDVIQTRAHEMGARYVCPDGYADGIPRLKMSGIHQRNNAAVAWGMIEASGLGIGDGVISRGLSKATWEGRYEKIGAVIFDGAHNSDAAEVLASTITDDGDIGKRLDILVGFSTGHDPKSFMDVLLRGLRGKDVRVFVTSFEHERMQRVEEVMERLVSVIPAQVGTHPSLVEDIGGWLAERKDSPPLLVTGTLYLVGKVREAVSQPLLETFSRG